MYTGLYAGSIAPYNNLQTLNAPTTAEVPAEPYDIGYTVRSNVLEDYMPEPYGWPELPPLPLVPEGEIPWFWVAVALAIGLALGGKKRKGAA